MNSAGSELGKLEVEAKAMAARQVAAMLKVYMVYTCIVTVIKF